MSARTTTSVSQAVSALVSALPLERGRGRIVITELEFPTVGQIAPAQLLPGNADEPVARIVGRLELDAFDARKPRVHRFLRFRVVHHGVHNPVYTVEYR